MSFTDGRSGDLILRTRVLLEGGGTVQQRQSNQKGNTTIGGGKRSSVKECWTGDIGRGDYP